MSSPKDIIPLRQADRRRRDGTLDDPKATRLNPKALRKNFEIPEETLGGTSTDLLVFYRCFSTLLNAGVPLVKCLEVCALSASVSFGSALYQVAGEVAKGNSLWGAMRRFPAAFRRHHVEMLAVGGESGQLAAVCGYLAQSTEKEAALWMELRKALTYPCIVAGLAFLAVLALPPLIFGPLFAFFEATGAELPWLTRMVAFFSRLVGRPEAWLLAGILILAGAGFLQGLLRRPRTVARLERLILSLPWTRELYAAILTIRFSNAFRLVLSVGVPMQRCLVLAAQTTGSVYLEQKLEESLSHLHEGGNLRDALAKSDVFGSLFLAFVQTGSESGQLTALLERVEEMLQTEAQARVESLLTLLEPLALLLMGGVVGIFVLAAMLPMAKLLETL